MTLRMSFRLGVLKLDLGPDTHKLAQVADGQRGHSQPHLQPAAVYLVDAVRSIEKQFRDVRSRVVGLFGHAASYHVWRGGAA